MSATVSWNEDRIIELEFDNPWTWRDYDTAAEAVDLMAGFAHENISMIVDLRKAPQSGTTIEHIHRTLDTMPDNIDCVVLVAGAIMVEMLRRALACEDGQLPDALRFAGTMEEAHRLLLDQPAEPCRN
jgi:hypothetical protein